MKTKYTLKVKENRKKGAGEHIADEMRFIFSKNLARICFELTTARAAAYRAVEIDFLSFEVNEDKIGTLIIFPLLE